MERREFLVTVAAGAAALTGVRPLFAQGRGNPPDWSADPGKPAVADPAKLARISMMTLNFSPLLKLPPSPPNPNAQPAAPNPNAPPPPPRTLEIFDIAQMPADAYGPHNA